jgi:5-methyltetrahydropteroyltriglutamate--homocysteine methyltransferase
MPRIRTTHVGSLIRPPLIIERMRAAEAGEPVDEAAFEAELTTAVRRVVQQQADIGLDVPSDGEFGKRGWTQYVAERLEGFSQDPARSARTVTSTAPDADRFGGFYREYGAFERLLWLPEDTRAKLQQAEPRGGGGGWYVSGPIRYIGRDAVQRDIRNFQAALAAAGVAEGFLPVVAPCSVAAARANDFYRSDEEYLYAIADALSMEYHAIADAGLTLQVDDAFLPLEGRTWHDLGAFRRWAAVRQEALNHALRGIPPEQVRYHICWGSQNHPHVSDVPLRELVEVILLVNAGAYVIEAANPRHEWEWTVWQDVKLPDGKTLVPGVVTHSTNVVEHPETVAQRLVNFASVVGAERLMAGTDCGFSQNWNLIRVHESIQWAKLEALVEGARLASQRL